MDTRKPKLIVGLLAAGAVAGGFGAAVLPASAEPRTIVVTLLGGQSITLTIDVPPGTPLDQMKLPGIDLPIISIKEVGGPVTTVPLPGLPGTTAPAPPETAPPAGAMPDAPAAQDKAPQATSGKEKRKPRDDEPLTEGEAVVEQAEEAEKARRRKTQTRTAGGAPTIQNPGFSLALPGPAPIGVPNFFIEKFRIPPFLLPIYQAAGIEYGLRWEVLAAINEIETDYGRNLNVSSAGAVGWMQFLPSTWKAYGVDANGDGKKDPYNPVDAIFGAARYLKAAGANEDLRKAVFAYNRADWYVDSVLMRARLIGGLPADLVGSLSGLTQGRFPVAARATYADDLSERDTQRKIAKGRNASIPVEADASRRSVDIFADAGSPAVAVQDGRVVNMGTSARLGKFVQLQDGFGNTYTYANLKKVARAVPVLKDATVTREEVRKELGLPADPKPTAPASAGAQGKGAIDNVVKATDEVIDRAVEGKDRIFAQPTRDRAAANGGEEQALSRELQNGKTTLKSYVTEVFGLDRDDVDIKRLKVGSKIVAGTILGRLGTTERGTDPHLRFEIRPAGEGAPRIDPKPILDGWKLLESTAVYRAAGKNPLFGPDAKGATIGQILLMGKGELIKRVLANPRIDIYECGRRDIGAGLIDRRVLATLEYLAAGGLKPGVSSLRCGRSSIFTASGNLSAHPAGAAVDIPTINGSPILGNQGAGSITEAAIRRLLTLQGTLKPNQIISLMTFDGADNTIALPDHADHIHVGFSPLAGVGTRGKALDAVLKPSQWIKLIDRLGQIDNPTVRTTASKYAVPVPKSERASRAHKGE